MTDPRPTSDEWFNLTPRSEIRAFFWRLKVRALVIGGVTLDVLALLASESFDNLSAIERTVARLLLLAFMTGALAMLILATAIVAHLLH